MSASASRPRPVVDGLKALVGARAALPATSRALLTDGPVEYLKAGDGAPGVVLLGGVGVPIEGWALVAPPLARSATVLAYNARGIGASAPPRRPQTAGVVVDMLRELLAAAGLAPPVVLVAHGLGGLHANLFARRFSRDVAGVVLVESAHPHDTLDERRLRFVPRAFIPRGGGKGWRRHDALYRSADTAAEIARAGPFPDVPLTVISGGRTPPRWTTSPEQALRHAVRQAELVELSARGTHAVAPASGHFPQVTDPEVVVRAVRALVAT